MGKAILKITDGTVLNTVNLLNRSSGYILCDWRPARPEFEYSVNKNWISGKEIPSMVSQKPAIDTFTLNAVGKTVDRLIEYEQKLNRILYMASIYWTGDRTVREPFYIVAKSKDETNVRYAVIFSAQLHDSSNPYAQPFFSLAPMDTGLIVPISHGEWLDHPPGLTGDEMLGAVASIIDSNITGFTHGAYLLGPTSLINDNHGPILSNFSSHDCISHMYRGDATLNSMGSGFSGYVMPLFVTGDTSPYTYYGIEHTGLAAATQISLGWVGIYFNITKKAILDGSPPDFKWEAYEEGEGWYEIVVDDGTWGFTRPGLVLHQVSGTRAWTNTSINGVSGFWCRVSPLNTFTQIPEVSVTPPSAPTMAYFDILFADNDHVADGPGEIPDFFPGSGGAYFDISLKLISPSWFTPLAKYNTTKLYIGARSLIESGDSSFHGYLPVYDPDIAYSPQNVTGIEYELPAGASIVRYAGAYTGFAFSNTLTITSPGEEELFLSLSFNSVASGVYRGAYKVFMRLVTTIGTVSGKAFFSCGVSQAPPYSDTGPKSGLSKSRWVTDSLGATYVTTLDMGTITLGSEDNMPQYLNVYYRYQSVSPRTARVYDIVLIPQDEWYTEITLTADSGIENYSRELKIGSVTPSGDLRTIVTSYNQTNFVPMTVPGASLSLLGNDTRFITLSTVHDIDRATLDPDYPIPVQYSHHLQFYELVGVDKVNKYFNSRGSK